VEPRTPASLAAGDAAHARRLARGFGALVVLVYGLIVLGALVRSHGAGLACPDWPLCFGEWVPRFDFHVAFEWGHRLVAGIVSLLFVGLSAAALSRPGTRRVTKTGIAVAATVLAVQIVLGGLTVLHLLARWTVTSHLLVGNAFAVSLLWLSCRLAEAGGQPVRRAPVSGALRLAVAACAGLLVLQIALGGLVSSSYAGLACPDWPTCRDGVWFPGFEGALGLHLAHRSVGYAVLLALAVAAGLARGAPPLGRRMALALGVALVQVALGVANVWLRIPVEVTALHSAGAAALVLLLALAVRDAFAAPRPERHAPVEGLARVEG